jgi:hypothetical protein
MDNSSPRTPAAVASGGYVFNIALLDPIFHDRIFSLAIRKSSNRPFPIGEKEREAVAHSVVERVIVLGVKRVGQKI